MALRGANPKAVDNIIESLRRQGWTRACELGKVSARAPEHGAEALGSRKRFFDCSWLQAEN